jgi:hypothetical protein
MGAKKYRRAFCAIFCTAFVISISRYNWQFVMARRFVENHLGQSRRRDGEAAKEDGDGARAARPSEGQTPADFPAGLIKMPHHR